MKYLHIVNGEKIVYPYGVDRVRTENPQVSFPREIAEDTLARYDVYPVKETERPPATERIRWKEGTPEFRNGAWRQVWQEEKLSPPGQITRRQCAIELLERKMISPGEALAMTKSGEMPQAIRAVIEKHIPDIGLRIRAKIDFAAGDYYRENELLKLMGLTDEELDEFFWEASRH